MLHRDLKPSNILATSHGTVKVLDFGLAKRLPDSADYAATALTGPEVIAGTPAYMSPEQALGIPLDGRSDIFSFGAVLYEMATGQRAFAGTSMVSVLAAVLREDPKLPTTINREIPPELETIILRCLSKAAPRRPSSMKDVRSLLQDVQATSGPGPRPRRDRLAGWRAVAVVAAVAVTGAAGAWLLRRAPVTAGPAASLKPVPMTSYLGFEWNPTLSPDGTQAAYSGNVADSDNADVYVQVIGANAAPLRLTTHPDDDFFPSWSPDGHWVVFERSDRGNSNYRLVRISSLGGSETELTDRCRGRTSWSRDSRWLS